MDKDIAFIFAGVQQTMFGLIQPPQSGQTGPLLEHKTFGLAINRDYLSMVFTSDHPCPAYIVYSQYTGGLWRNQHQKQKMARPINREGTYFMLYSTHSPGVRLIQCTIHLQSRTFLLLQQFAFPNTVLGIN